MGYKDKVKQSEYNRQWRAERRKRVYDYLLTHPCVDCGESDPIVLEFDHVRGAKTCNVAKLIVSANDAKLMAEIAKCEVRCANCHRRKTVLCNEYMTKRKNYVPVV